MPLYESALAQIRANLEALQRGERVTALTIGQLTEEQVKAINQIRASAKSPQPPIRAVSPFLRPIQELRVAFFLGKTPSRREALGYSYGDTALAEKSTLLGGIFMRDEW